MGISISRRRAWALTLSFALVLLACMAVSTGADRAYAEGAAIPLAGADVGNVANKSYMTTPRD